MPQPRASNPFLQPEDEDASAIHDVPRVHALLLEAVRERRAISYSELLGRLGLRFTRPKMRALCRTLDRIDETRPEGAPGLAVLVVRESDGLPGQGWWAGGHAASLGHDGEWQGARAAAFVRALQERVYDWYGAHATAGPRPR